MGFGANRATRALYLGGSDGVEEAVQWMVEHENDEDVDQPLLVQQGQVHPKLTEDEARKKAEEMLLALIGFEEDASGEYLVLEEKNVDAPLLHSAGEELHSALNNPFFGVL
eukprot:jgi/Pico_ML_1/53348/g3910.t1